MEENKRVLLGMSGGTDSSVAAMRLLEAGYEVIGVTFRFYELNGSTEYLEDARNLAERLGKEDLPPLEKEYRSIYFSHAFFGIVQAWINRGKEESPQYMTDFLIKMLP
mgnify:CR=1 FL=1